MRYKVSRWVLDTTSGRVHGPDGELHLRPQTFRLFKVLVEQAPELLSVDELIDRAWDVEHVSVGTFRQAVSELRQALGDSASDPQIIATVPRRGYRLMVPVEPLPTTPSIPEPSHTTRPGAATEDTFPASPVDRPPNPNPLSPRRTGVFLSLIAACALFVALGFRADFEPDPPPLAAPSLSALDPQTSRQYHQALDDIAALNFEAARHKLETVGEASPENPWILERLSLVYERLGLDSLAAETARRAALAATGGPWEIVSSANARVAETRGNWTTAAEILQALQQRHPEQRDYGLRLARAWNESGRTDAALQLIAKLRSQTGPHPSLDLLELDVLAATNALDDAEALGRRLASAEDSAVNVPARLQLFSILLRRGSMEEAETIFKELEDDAAEATGPRLARIIRSHAFLIERQGSANEALTLYRQAASLFQVHGDRDAWVSLLNRQALFLMKIGDRDEARRVLIRGIETARLHGLDRRLVVALCLLAQIDAGGPEPEHAWEPLQEAQLLTHGPQEPRRQILWHRSRGDVYLATGDMESALREYTDCLRLAEDIGDDAGKAYAQLGLSTMALRQGRMDLALHHAQSAVAGFERLGQVPDVLNARLQMATVEAARGRPLAARAALVDVAEVATSHSMHRLEALATQGLSRLPSADLDLR